MLQVSVLQVSATKTCAARTWNALGGPLNRGMAQPAREQPSRLKVYSGTALAWLVLAVWNTAPSVPVASITAKNASLWPMKAPYLPAVRTHTHTRIRVRA